MNELNRQICQCQEGVSERVAIAGGKDLPSMADLLEPVVGLVSMSRICAYYVRHDNPDLDELREVIGMLVTSSEAVLSMIQHDPA